MKTSVSSDNEKPVSKYQLLNGGSDRWQFLAGQLLILPSIVGISVAIASVTSPPGFDRTDFRSGVASV